MYTKSPIKECVSCAVNPVKRLLMSAARQRRKVRTHLLAILVATAVSACAVHRLDVSPIDVGAEEPISIASPVKLHLKDGSTVVFAGGIVVSASTIHGSGVWYDLTLQDSRSISEVNVADVAAAEALNTPVDQTQSATASVGAVTAGVVGTALLSLALFGSCPTLYALDAGSPLLEAELFSYSISPAFQARDVDRLAIRTPVDGLVELELRNEMLETHYIDHLELLEVSHAEGKTAYPDENGKPLVVGEQHAPINASDQDRHNVLPELRRADGKAWETTTERLNRVSADDHLDHIDLEFQIPADSRNPALVLRLRNSLLNTVLFYDVMLKAQGIAAVDWLGKDLNRFSTWARMGHWYRSNMGLTVSVWDGQRYRKHARLNDQGPIAWSERAIRLPGAQSGLLKVRLSFVADNWRIDSATVAIDAERDKSRTIGVSSLSTRDGNRHDLIDAIDTADKNYLVTQPGDRLRLAFEVGSVEPGRTRSFFLGSNGYYTEWLRGEWLTGPKSRGFDPGEDALLLALEMYADQRDGLRDKFERTKVEVR